LSFTSNHPIQVKRAVVISLVDRVLKLASPEHISSGHIIMKDILIPNGYPEIFQKNTISQITEKKKKKLMELVILEHEGPTHQKNSTTLPYIPMLCNRN